LEVYNSRNGIHNCFVMEENNKLSTMCFCRRAADASRFHHIAARPAPRGASQAGEVVEPWAGGAGSPPV